MGTKWGEVEGEMVNALPKEVCNIFRFPLTLEPWPWNSVLKCQDFTAFVQKMALYIGGKRAPW